MITRFFGPLGVLSLCQFPEGNTLVATEFVRLLEVSGSITANDPTGRQRMHSYLVPTVAFNPTRTRDETENITNTG